MRQTFRTLGKKSRWQKSNSRAKLSSSASRIDKVITTSAFSNTTQRMIVDGKSRKILEKKKYKRYGNVVTVYKISFADGYDNTDPMTEFDYAVLSVCISNFEEGNVNIMPAIIYRGLTGKSNTARMQLDQCTAILNSLRKLMGTIIEIRGMIIPKLRSVLKEDDFHRPEHQMVYRVLLSLYDAGIEPNVLLFSEELRKRGKLERISLRYIFMLSEFAWTTGYAETHAKVIKEKAILKRFMSEATEMLGDLQADTEETTSSDIRVGRTSGIR